ncbi:hypothetical protein BESB_010450 [Besnoitia besnoiti]|uniref:Uncharacterized protein n=1 Tax=Besnoitia besnoiti TaxID=94643 RepID=A0A2A9MQR9_BESBE|nr:hypothetical protein BESB_010450 [Besnoitia besnoiti]PFH38703.1 hypothetical protein BESB_010450 [Besnoitia besnoiti]
MDDKATLFPRVEYDGERVPDYVQQSRSDPPSALLLQSEACYGVDQRSISRLSSASGTLRWSFRRQGTSRAPSSVVSFASSDAGSAVGRTGQRERSSLDFRAIAPALGGAYSFDGSGIVSTRSIPRRATSRGPRYARAPYVFSHDFLRVTGRDEGGNGEVKKLGSERPSLAARFVKQVHQETCHGIYPLWAAGSILWLCLVGAVFFISVGAWLIVEDEQHVECKLSYAEKTLQEGGSKYLLKGISSAHCTHDVDELKGQEISVYAELEHFYQNDAQIVWSRSDRQLAGAIFTDPNDVRDCEPLATALVDNVTKVLHPCGVLAWSVFTDKYQFLEGTPDGDNDQVPMKPIPLTQNQNVLLSSWQWRDTYRNPPARERAAVLDKVYFWMSPDDNDDGEDMYKSREEARAELLVDRLNYEEAGEMVENGHFIQWMQTAALGTFRKLYGRLEGPLKLPVSAHITVTYDVSSWNGKKAIVLVQNSRFGGRSLFIGIAYLSFGCLLTMLVFYVLWKKWQYRREGEEILDLRWQPKSGARRKTK